MKYIAILLLLITSVAHSSEYLEPEDSQFTGLFMPDYYGMVLSAFDEAYQKNVLAKVVVFPSFQPEYTVFLKKANETFKIVCLSPEKSFWGYKTIEMMKNESVNVLKNGEFVRDDEGIAELEKEYPKKYTNIEINRCEVEINSSIAKSIIDIWQKMLLQTRYTKKTRNGLDGTTYHFSMTVDFQNFGGKTWSPNTESNTGKLVEISNFMREKCQTGNKTLDGKIQEAIKALDRKL